MLGQRHFDCGIAKLQRLPAFGNNVSAFRCPQLCRGLCSYGCANLGRAGLARHRSDVRDVVEMGVGNKDCSCCLYVGGGEAEIMASRGPVEVGVKKIELALENELRIGIS